MNEPLADVTLPGAPGMTGRVLRGCAVTTICAMAGLSACAIAYAVYASRIPHDSPIARMYRAETDIGTLVRAVEVYRKEHGAYPEPGMEGLRKATAQFSSKAVYFPGGPPMDPWGRAYQYVSHERYAEPGSAAMRGPDGYYMPDGVQVYSMGADGDAGLEDASHAMDNLSNWDKERSWRALYKTLHKQYMEERR